MQSIGRENYFSKPGSAPLKINIKVFLKSCRVIGNHKKDLTPRCRDQLLAYHVALDLVLIQIEQFDGSLAWIEFADSGRVVAGDQVYTLVIPSRAASIRLFFKMHLFDRKRGTPGIRNDLVFTLMPLRSSILVSHPLVADHSMY